VKKYCTGELTKSANIYKATKLGENTNSHKAIAFIEKKQVVGSNTG